MAPRRKPQSSPPEVGRIMRPSDQLKERVNADPAGTYKEIEENKKAAQEEIQNLKDTLAAKDLAEQQARAARERAARPGIVDRIKNKIEEVAGPARDVLIGAAVKSLVKKEQDLQKYVDISIERYRTGKGGDDSSRAGLARQITEAKKELASVSKARISMAKFGKAVGYTGKSKKKK